MIQLQIAALAAALYLSIVLLLSLLRAFFALRRGTSFAKQKFCETFGTFFLELVNPLNWF